MLDLRSKVAEKVAKTPVHIRLNMDYTAVQISKAAMQEKSILFLKNGRKTVPDAAEILKRNHIPLPKEEIEQQSVSGQMLRRKQSTAGRMDVFPHS